MLFLMPMLLLSGAFFPIEQAHWLISWIRHINPMTYGLGALRHALHGVAPGCPTFTICMVGTTVFAVATFALGTYVVTRRSARHAACARGEQLDTIARLSMRTDGVSDATSK